MVANWCNGKKAIFSGRYYEERVFGKMLYIQGLVILKFISKTAIACVDNVKPVQNFPIKTKNYTTIVQTMS